MPELLCRDLLNLDEAESMRMNLSYDLMINYGRWYSFQTLVSLNIIALVTYSLSLIGRTNRFRHIIIMFSYLVQEFAVNLAAFSSLIGVFIMTMRLLEEQIL